MAIVLWLLNSFTGVFSLCAAVNVPSSGIVFILDIVGTGSAVYVAANPASGAITLADVDVSIDNIDASDTFPLFTLAIGASDPLQVNSSDECYMITVISK